MITYLSKLALLFFVPALTALASISITTVDQVYNSSFRVIMATTVQGNIRVSYQVKGVSCPAAADLFYSTMLVWIGGAGNPQRTVAGLARNVTYCIAAWNTNNNERSAVQEVTTLSYSGPRPIPPTLPTEFDHGMPTINGNTYTVLSDCSNLTSSFNTAAAVAGTANHEVVLPAGVTCTMPSGYEFPARVGTGWIVVRTSTPAAQFTPEGTRWTPAWGVNKLATIQGVARGQPYWAKATLRISAATSKWRFVGIEVTHQAGCAGCLDIASVTTGATTTVVTTGAHGLSNGNLVRGVTVPGVTGLTGASATAAVTVVNSTTFTVPLATSGTYTSGGQIIHSSTDDDAYGYLIWIHTSVSDVLFDRCYVHGRTFPDREYYGTQFAGARNGVINSTFEGARNWHLVVPGSINPEYGPYNTNMTLDFTEAKQFMAVNNAFDVVGVGLFSQEGATRTTDDVVFRRNLIKVSGVVRYRSTGDNPESDGHYYIHRMPMEYKQVKRALVEGNLFEGQYMDQSPPGPSLLFYLRGPLQGGDGPAALDDITARNNIFRNASGAIQIVGEDDQPTQGAAGTHRVALTNNLMYNIDGFTYKTQVNSGSSNRGFCLWLLRSINDLLVDQNTCWDIRGTGPMTFLMGMNRSGHAQVTRNVFQWNTEEGIGGFFYDDQGAGPLPMSISGGTMNTKSRFDDGMAGNWQQNPNPSFTFADNILVGGVKNGAGYDSTSTSDQWNRFSLCDASTGIFGSVVSRNYCVGTNLANTGSETARTRMNAVGFRSWITNDFRFSLSSNFVKYNAGADVSRIMAAYGELQNPWVMSVGTTTAKITYKAPDEAACSVEVSTSDEYGSGAAVSDGGGGRWREVNVSDLSPATDYYARVRCARTIELQFATRN